MIIGDAIWYKELLSACGPNYEYPVLYIESDLVEHYYTEIDFEWKDVIYRTDVKGLVLRTHTQDSYGIILFSNVDKIWTGRK